MKMRLFRKSPFLWIRDLHLYFGLFISPFVLIFAASTLLLNHTCKPWDTPADAEAMKTEMPVEIPEETEGIDLAKAIMRQVGISGEIRYIHRRKGSLVIPVMKPGQNTTIKVDLENRTARVEQRNTDLWEVLFYLHKSPGPHNADIRGNWVFTRLWGWLADTVVYLLLFISASGIYLWAVIKAERKTGLVLMGAGCLCFFAVVSAVVL